MSSKALLCYFLGGLAGLQGATWTTPATIPATPSSQIHGSNLYGAFNSSTGQLFAAWQDDGATTNRSTYSTYTVSGGWSFPQVMNNDIYAFYDIFLAYDPDRKAVFAGLADGANSQRPTVLIFENGAWGSPQVIDNQVTNDLFLVYNPVSRLMFAAWTNSANTANFATYDGGSWTVSSITSDVLESVTLTCNSDTGEVFAAWVDNVTNFPLYAVYPLGGPWSSPQPISATATTAYTNVFLTYNAQLGQVFAAWNDSNTATYSVYNGTSWSPLAPISTTELASTDVYLEYNSATGQVFAAWENLFPTYLPVVSIYDPVGKTWDTTLLTSPFAVLNDVSLVYASGFTTMFALWEAYPPPFYPVWSSSFFLPSPTNFSGSLARNDFGTVSETFARLRWSFAPFVEGYKLYQNGKLVATLDSATNSYSVHNLPGGSNTFTLVAFNAGGDSAPASVTLK